MRPALRRFVFVVTFEVALLVVATLVLDRVSPLVLGVVVVAVIAETIRLGRSADDDSPLASAPPPRMSAAGTLLHGADVARDQGLDPDSTDPRAVATAFTDVEPGQLQGYPYTIGLHDEVRLLFDEDALADEDPDAWSDDGPIGDAVRAQPGIASVLREDREVVHVQPASPDVGPREVHAAAVAALLDLHRRRPGDLTDLA